MSTHDIHISYKGKNARVLYAGQAKPEAPEAVSSTGLELSTIDILHGISKDATAATILDNSAINLSTLGTVIEDTTPVYIDSDNTPVTNFRIFQEIYDASNQLKDTKPATKSVANVNGDLPVQVLKTIPLQSLLTKFVITNSYQLYHTDGVQFDFLYNIAKDLSTSNQAALIGVGPKALPLVFKSAGRAYRAALIGNILDDTYQLRLVLLGQEIKLPN